MSEPELMSKIHSRAQTTKTTKGHLLPLSATKLVEAINSNAPGLCALPQDTHLTAAL